MANPRRDRLWLEFKAWCARRRLKALPAHPWTVAAYLRWCERRRRFPTLVKILDIIARVHLLSCKPPPHDHPIVLRTLRMMERRARNKGQRSALFDEKALLAGGKGAGTEGEGGQTTTRRGLRSSPRLVSRRNSRDT